MKFYYMYNLYTNRIQRTFSLIGYLSQTQAFELLSLLFFRRIKYAPLLQHCRNQQSNTGNYSQTVIYLKLVYCGRRSESMKRMNLCELDEKTTLKLLVFHPLINSTF